MIGNIPTLVVVVLIGGNSMAERNKLGQFVKGHKNLSTFSPFKKGYKRKFYTSGMLGKKHSKESKEKMRTTNNAGHFKMGNHSRTEFKEGQLVGEKNPFWKGGISPYLKRLRDSIEYKRWRMAVFMRDNFTCQFCGIRGNQTGGYLEAHHIKSWTKHPELRFKVENGVTLCQKCHRLLKVKY